MPHRPERILLLAPTAADADLSRRVLGEAGIVCEVCPTIADLLRETAGGAGALLLTDEALDPELADRLVTAVDAQPAWSDLPIVLLSGSGADSPGAVWAMERLGNVTVLERPARVNTLVSALQTAIRSRRRQYELRDQLAQRAEAEARVRALNAELRDELARARRFHEVSTQLVQSKDFGLHLKEILAAALEITRADRGDIHLLERGHLRLAAHRGLEAGYRGFFETVPVGEAAAGKALATGARIIVEELAGSELFDVRIREALLAAGVHSTQSTPLISSSGAMLGVLSTYYRRPGTPSDADLRLIDLLSRQASDMLERLRGEEALREADRRKDEFLATLAHELRNPLAPIRNSLHILRLRGQEAGTVDQVRIMMERQLGQMVRLIDDLLDVSRITRGRLELRRERVELAAVMRAALDTASPLIEAAGHRLEIETPAEPVYVDADPIRLAQVLSNLLNNAAKYTERGGHIRFSGAREGRQAVVRVRDDGVGLLAEDLARIFDMFSQVDRSLEKSQGGLGIGLTLVRKLVELHGGSVEAYSAGIGEGSEFVVRLAAVAATPRRASEPAPASADTEPAPCRILVADDNRDAAESLGLLLRLTGCEVRTVNDGARAVEEAADFRPDLVLLDIGMPVMNGYDAARAIRNQRWSAGMILVALTGWGQNADRERAAEAGFDRHFTKPVDPAELEQLVRGLRAGRDPRRTAPIPGSAPARPSG
jgi:signal transduction histidine kinase/CheY-like chemotaxis protein